MVLRFLLEKEFKQMWRNILLPVLFAILPLGLINGVPRIATQEVKNVKYVLVDNDHSTFSQRLTQKIAASRYMTFVSTEPTYERAMQHVEQGTADVIVEIQPDFERDLMREGQAHVRLAANAVNGQTAGLGSSYVAQIIADFAAQLREEAGLSATGTVLAGYDVRPRFLFNTELDYKPFMIPALMAMLLVITVGFLPALNIVGEKEKGTIEQINVTPVSRMEFILSKLIPYWVVGLFLLGYAILVARLFFDIVPAGSVGLLFAGATLFILVVSSFGLIVSNYSATTQQASLVMFFFLVIFLLMSGLLTPVSSMPQWAQTITLFNPLRYFIELMRMLYLKGSDFSALTTQFSVLAIFAGVMGAWAIISYKKSA